MSAVVLPASSACFTSGHVIISNSTTGPDAEECGALVGYVGETVGVARLAWAKADDTASALAIAVHSKRFMIAAPVNGPRKHENTKNTWFGFVISWFRGGF